MRRNPDLIVIGGGPAGSSCAARAAGRGLSVALLERARFPRAKPCAGGLSFRAFPALGSLPTSIVNAEPRTAEIVLSDDVALVWRGERPGVVTTTRLELDAHLARAAREAGARVIEGTAARIAGSDDVGVVEAGGERWSAPWIVAADGVLGRSRSLLGIPAGPMGGAVYVRVRRPDGSAVSERAVFDLRAGPSGYGWLFPKRDHCSVGVFHRGPVSDVLRSRLNRFLDDQGLSGLPSEGPFAFPVPLRTGPFGRGRTLFIGDAAGLADPITGEGIPHAVASGRVAADAVADAAVRNEDALILYRRRVRNDVVRAVNEFRVFGRLVYGVGPGAFAHLLTSRIGRVLVKALAPPGTASGLESLHVETPLTRRSQ